jgi:hypothetical protein
MQALPHLLTNPRGKIDRINSDGTITTDNFFGENVNSVWAVWNHRAWQMGGEGALIGACVLRAASDRLSSRAVNGQSLLRAMKEDPEQCE